MYILSNLLILPQFIGLDSFEPAPIIILYVTAIRSCISMDYS